MDIRHSFNRLIYYLANYQEHYHLKNLLVEEQPEVFWFLNYLFHLMFLPKKKKYIHVIKN